MALEDKSWLMRCDAPLSGRVEVAGAKNTVTKLMAAACLASGVSRLGGVPDIADVNITAAMLRGIGVGVALLTQASGVSAVHETVFEDRLGFTDELVKMGAVIDRYPQCLGEAACRFGTAPSNHSALIAGPSRLVGSELVMPDIRAGFGLVVGAIAAQGESLLQGVHHLERGYDNVAEKLGSVGCEITRDL